MYEIYIKPDLQKKLRKLKRKNPTQFEIFLKKTQEILQDPIRYKNLRAPMSHLKRVHIDTQFVLTFSVKDSIVTLVDLEHHDAAY